MEVQLFEEVVDGVRSLVLVVNPIERAACGIYRQRGDIQMFAIRGYRGDPGRNAETNVADLAQFLHHSVDLLRIGSPWVED